MLKSLRDYSNPNSLGSRLRRRRFKHIEELVRRVLESSQRCTIFDAGGTSGYWGLMAPDLLERCDITISNLEKHRGEDPRDNVPAKGVFDFHYGDGRDLHDIADKQFDIAHSNSVIEHVGRVSDMHAYCKEMTRIATYFFVQTPNFWFPVEPHYGAPFVHWLPAPVRARLLSRFSIGFHKKYAGMLAAYDFVEFINLIDRRVLESLLPDGVIRKEKLLLFTKSIMSMGPRALLERTSESG